jgi:hypothetical protein
VVNRERSDKYFQFERDSNDQTTGKMISLNYLQDVAECGGEQVFGKISLADENSSR